MSVADLQIDLIKRHSAQIVRAAISRGDAKMPAVKVSTQDALRKIRRDEQNARNAKKRMVRDETCLYCKNLKRGGRQAGAHLCQDCYDGE
jgi:hypothetical protein